MRGPRRNSARPLRGEGPTGMCHEPSMNFTSGDLDWWTRMASGMDTRLVDGWEKEEGEEEEEEEEGEDILRMMPEGGGRDLDEDEGGEGVNADADGARAWLKTLRALLPLDTVLVFGLSLRSKRQQPK
mmetsp:Transcript_21720/g.43617  ORF Transcript_21720/g.43617 Transcript_21720/m.43617 type:complete len:128 (+) Transcript_21720:843-1226(+)